ncbi:hypothetical protein [Helicobacter cappadocius]|uniref:Outer membrane protein beta-barrel domain-containing protein n=1 Tax=Helicobacter cappadocius TaxID=3063998 RepID=A0AA90PV39_9HELI|nr:MULTISPECIES: hypothetical protein [unclassified Helicobacter]MDO7252975.1 hypothetical protein [Helicobacter sp. faydin-H75]MDP2539035.1 hypothetical protein [Helicobacter sp. faydin-H76]
MRNFLLVCILTISTYAQGGNILLEIASGTTFPNTKLEDTTTKLDLKSKINYDYSFRIGYEYKYSNQGFFVRYNYTNSWVDDYQNPLKNRNLFEFAYLVGDDMSYGNNLGFYVGFGLGFAKNNFKYSDFIFDHYAYASYRRTDFKITPKNDYLFLSNLMLGIRYSKRNFYISFETNIGYTQAMGDLNIKYQDHPSSGSIYRPDPPSTYLSTTSSIKETFFPFSVMLVFGFPIDLFI